jgi:hypothetical protein
MLMASESYRRLATECQALIAPASAWLCRLDSAALGRKVAKQPVWRMRPAAFRAERRRDSLRRLVGHEFLISDLRQKPVSVSPSRAVAALDSVAQTVPVRLLAERKPRVRA